MYDGFGVCVKTVETVSGTTTSTKQVIIGDGGMCEVRDAGGTTIFNQFYKYGETIGGNRYYFSYDKLKSVRELTDSTGNIQAEYYYDPFGQAVKVAEVVASDFGFGGYSAHNRSGLWLSATREYSPFLGRWLSRDPAEREYNPFLYVSNAPSLRADTSGLFGEGILGFFGFMQLQGSKGYLQSLCNCPSCGVPTDRVQDCHTEANRIAYTLANAWVANYNMIDEAQTGDKIGGHLCYEWAKIFYDALVAEGPFEYWAFQKERTWSLPFQHQWVHLWIANKPTPALCEAYVDDGYETGVLFHEGTQPQPWPGQPVIRER